MLWSRPSGYQRWINRTRSCHVRMPIQYTSTSGSVDAPARFPTQEIILKGTKTFKGTKKNCSKGEPLAASYSPGPACNRNFALAMGGQGVGLPPGKQACRRPQRLYLPTYTLWKLLVSTCFYHFSITTRNPQTVEAGPMWQQTSTLPRKLASLLSLPRDLLPEHDAHC